MRIETLLVAALISLTPVVGMAQDVKQPLSIVTPSNSVATITVGLETLAAKYRGSSHAPEPMQVPVLEKTPENIVIATMLADIMRGGGFYYRH